MKPVPASTTDPPAASHAELAVSPAPQPAFFVVLNAGSGSTDAAECRATVEAVLREANREVETLLVDNPQRMREAATSAAQRAVACGGIVVAAGGDGTINAVAQAALEAGCPIGVIPRGTFNYFARTHGIPSEPAEAAKLLLSSRAQPVQVGVVNGRIILVNASVGLYPKLLEERERHSEKYGRSRWGALVAGLRHLLRERRHLRLRIDSDGTLRQVRTPTLFIGNNPLQLQQLGLPVVQMLACGRLAAVVPDAVGLPTMLWLLLRGAFGQLGTASDISTFGFQEMRVMPRRAGRSATGRRMKVAIDGEVVQLAAPLAFRVSERPLYLLKPQRATAESAAGSSTDTT